MGGTAGVGALVDAVVEYFAVTTPGCVFGVCVGTFLSLLLVVVSTLGTTIFVSTLVVLMVVTCLLGSPVVGAGPPGLVVSGLPWCGHCVLKRGDGISKFTDVVNETGLVG